MVSIYQRYWHMQQKTSVVSLIQLSLTSYDQWQRRVKYFVSNLLRSFFLQFKGTVS